MPLTTMAGKVRRVCSPACGYAANLVAQREIDEVVVYRLRLGETVPSTHGERIEATRLLTSHGRSLSWIARQLHTTPRSISRFRHEINQLEEAA